MKTDTKLSIVIYFVAATLLLVIVGFLTVMQQNQTLIDNQKLPESEITNVEWNQDGVQITYEDGTGYWIENPR